MNGLNIRHQIEFQLSLLRLVTEPHEPHHAPDLPETQLEQMADRLTPITQ